MKTITLAAALILASTAANAGGYNFEIQGQKIRIEAPRNCNSLSCIQITAPGLSGNFKGLKSNKDDDVATTTTPAAPPAPPAPPAPAPVTQTTATAPQAVNYPPPPAPATTVDQPVLHDVVPGAPQPPTTTYAPPAPPAPAPVVAAAPPAPQQPVVAAPSNPNSPIGLWATEDGKGNVKIEQCGANLCGFSSDTHEKLLIDMQPEGSKWSGRIHDPQSGRNYDASIAMKSPNLLRVQGCAFGGMFCGGQTWKRVS